jgi:hypothetical protein
MGYIRERADVKTCIPIQLKVKEPAKWKLVFVKSATLRKNFGSKEVDSFSRAADPSVKVQSLRF